MGIWGVYSLPTLILEGRRIGKSLRNLFKMKVPFVFIVAFVVCINAQDTFHCPDGWDLHAPEGTDECECYLFADNFARVTHGDASLLCESHNGWLAELEDGPGDNYWVVQKLIDLNSKRKNKRSPSVEIGELGEAHFEDQWWIGAKSYTKHDEHRPGEWIWEHLNTTVDWFDWAPNEPNDYHRQQCLTFLRYDYGDDIFYNWNDWDCNTVADYICQKACDTY